MTSKQLAILCTTILLAALIAVAGNYLVLSHLAAAGSHQSGRLTSSGDADGEPLQMRFGDAAVPERGTLFQPGGRTASRTPLEPAEQATGRLRSGPEEGSGRPVPRILPEPGHASPIRPAAPLAEATVRNLIEQELPDATTEEREVWFQQLRDMQPGQIRDILQLWRRFGTRLLRESDPEFEIPAERR